jgi:hypothetical protein
LHESSTRLGESEGVCTCAEERRKEGKGVNEEWWWTGVGRVVGVRPNKTKNTNKKKKKNKRREEEDEEKNT